MGEIMRRMRDGKANVTVMRLAGLALAVRTTHAARRFRALVVADLGREQAEGELPVLSPGGRVSPASPVAAVAVTSPPAVVVSEFEDELALLRDATPVGTPALVSVARPAAVEAPEVRPEEIRVARVELIGPLPEPEGLAVPEDDGPLPECFYLPDWLQGSVAAAGMEEGVVEVSRLTEPTAAVEPVAAEPVAEAAVEEPEPVVPVAEAAVEEPEPVVPAEQAEPPAASWQWSEPWGFETEHASRRARRKRRNQDLRRKARRRWVGAAASVGALIIYAVAGTTAIPSSRSTQIRPVAAARPTNRPRPSAYAKKTIPAGLVRLYWRVGEEYGLDWTKIAAVMQIESDHGRSPLPGVHGGANGAGAAGPAQFIPGTWARYGVDADGRGKINPYDPVDAVTAMAAYLKASGAPQHWREALYTYNHSAAYVDAVMSLSHRFLAAPSSPH